MKGYNMKTLITKVDGSPVKSRIHAVQFLNKKGIDKDLLIEENGQFFYEAEEVFAEQVERPKAAEIFKHTEPLIKNTNVSWETPVFVKGEERTQLYIPNTDVVATIIGKHPAGQGGLKSSFEINIGNENFKMSVDLLSRIFKVKA